MKLYNRNTLNYTYYASSQSAQKTYTALLTAGKKYRVSFDFIIDGITTATYTVINGSNTVGTKLQNVTNHEVTEFTATNTNLTLVIELSAGNYGRLAHIDNLEIAEIAEVGESYRFGGAGGQEKDDEIFIGAYTAEYWEYDSRLGRRWNVDPVVRPYESPYVCFRNNPIFYIDVNGANPGDPKEHKVAKGDNLTKIAKKYGVEIKDLAKMNNLKDINKIKVGQVLKVNPEVEFSNSPLTNYNNPNNGSYEEVKNMGHTADVAANFVAGEGAENTIVSGGNALQEVQSLPTIQCLTNEGLSSLGKDGKFMPGEVFKSSFNIGNLRGENAKRIMKESLLNFFNPFTFNPYNNAFLSAENILGSYGFSMRVNADGKTMTIAVYDSKSIESVTDRQTNATNQQRTAESSAMFSNTYQRYIWSAPIPGK